VFCFVFSDLGLKVLCGPLHDTAHSVALQKFRYMCRNVLVPPRYAAPNGSSGGTKRAPRATSPTSAGCDWRATCSRTTTRRSWPSCRKRWPTISAGELTRPAVASTAPGRWACSRRTTRTSRRMTSRSVSPICMYNALACRIITFCVTLSANTASSCVNIFLFDSLRI
jgi:hypothetical protein